MDTANLKLWAISKSDVPVEDRSNTPFSLPEHLLRFRWKREETVGVGSDADDKLRINSVLNGVSWLLAKGVPATRTLNVVLGVEPSDLDEKGRLAEHIGAISTLVRAKRQGPRVRVWSTAVGGEPEQIAVAPTEFAPEKPTEWNRMLMCAQSAKITGMAKALVDKVQHPSLALYPKLSSLSGPEPWQVRLDGAEIGRVGEETFTLKLKTRNLNARGQPREGWLEAELSPEKTFNLDQVGSAAASIKALIEVWSRDRAPGSTLNNGHPEHGLEAHILSGRLELNGSQGLLRLVVPPSGGKLSAAQFPTLWGNVSRPWRYLDVLLADASGRPWAVELKDQYAAGGHGQYLRNGIAQAVLYRHFIRSAAPLDQWFEANNLSRTDCQAALAFPTASHQAANKIDRLRDLAQRFDVEVIEFARPGDPVI